MSLSALHALAVDAGFLVLGLDADDVRIEPGDVPRRTAKIVWTLPPSTHDNLGGVEISMQITATLWTRLSPAELGIYFADHLSELFRKLVVGASPCGRETA